MENRMLDLNLNQNFFLREYGQLFNASRQAKNEQNEYLRITYEGQLQELKYIYFMFYGNKIEKDYEKYLDMVERVAKRFGIND